ncbi:hypothetical protein OGAPHI_003280 [Ogataea philodendri]|uniref:Uncharacterized protein n=1 Tax=Ogataea philodendri TaxID=1378263 RepID=A0A9P8T6C5_9ASCO|nr:uncharacterized protein OGAPHI_003280 [Ogataea philodendri]KAH3666831.1 hypothetical protein OGAPHI_003280 [Ogataea philodendri]
MISDQAKSEHTNGEQVHGKQLASKGQFGKQFGVVLETGSKVPVQWVEHHKEDGQLQLLGVEVNVFSNVPIRVHELINEFHSYSANCNGLVTKKGGQHCVILYGVPLNTLLESTQSLFLLADLLLLVEPVHRSPVLRDSAAVSNAGDPRGDRRLPRTADLAGVCFLAQSLHPIVLIKHLVGVVLEVAQVGDQQGVLQRNKVAGLVVKHVDRPPRIHPYSSGLAGGRVFVRGVGAHDGKWHGLGQISVEFDGFLVGSLVVVEKVLVEVEDRQLEPLDVFHDEFLV